MSKMIVQFDLFTTSGNLTTWEAVHKGDDYRWLQGSLPDAANPDGSVHLEMSWEIFASFMRFFFGMMGPRGYMIKNLESRGGNE